MNTIKMISPKINAIEKIEHYIASNYLKENDKLLSERELSDMWNISRTTIRSAIEFLIGKGVLYKVKDSGTFISKSKVARNIAGVNTLTKNFRESGVAYSTKILSFRLIKANNNVANKLKISKNDHVYELIRLRSLQSDPAFIETMYLNAKMCPNLDKHYTEKSSLHLIYQNVYKTRPVGGQEHISVTYPTESEISILGVEENSPLFFTSGTTFTEHFIPLEYYKIVFRSDYFRFVHMIEDKEYRRK